MGRRRRLPFEVAAGSAIRSEPARVDGGPLIQPARPEPSAVGFAARPESLGRDDRIRRRTDFLRVYAEGRRVVSRLVVAFEAPSPTGRTRLGVTVTRKLGTAVERNRLRRRLREAFRRSPERPAPPAAVDVVFNVRDGAGIASFDAFAEDVTRVLNRLSKGRAR